MTLWEKLNQTRGKGKTDTGSGWTPSVERLSIPGFHMLDGSIGASGAGMLWPAGIGMAATWDVDLAQKVGAGMGKDWRSVGVNCGLAPMCNIVRDGRWGRSAEGFGEDPYLSGKMVAAEIRGMQSSGLAATTKHYTAYSTNSHN